MVDAARCFALVPCAGVGVRAGGSGPKQYAALAGRPVVAHTLAALAGVPRLVATLVVLAPADRTFAPLAEGIGDHRIWLSHRGGETRAATVAAGLQALHERGVADHDWVLVHDAARCLLRPQWVERLIDACIDDAVGGLLALPLADTLKQAGAGDAAAAGHRGGPRVAATLARGGKWLAQTPQMFRLGLLRTALSRAGPGITDDAGAVEAMGLAPRLVAGEIENFKLTWPADFVLAARLLETR